MVASGKARFYSSALMLSFLRFFIRIYQYTLSPVLSLICGRGSGCRFKYDPVPARKSEWHQIPICAGKEVGKLKTGPTFTQSNLDCVCE